MKSQQQQNQKLAEMIDALQKAWSLATDLDVEEVETDQYYRNRPHEMLDRLHQKVLLRLAGNGGLIGTEICNETGDVVGTVTKVDCSDVTSTLVAYQRPPGSEYPAGGECNCDIGPEHYFRLPGSAKYSWNATIELLAWKRSKLPEVCFGASRAGAFLCALQTERGTYGHFLYRACVDQVRHSECEHHRVPTGDTATRKTLSLCPVQRQREPS